MRVIRVGLVVLMAVVATTLVLSLLDYVAYRGGVHRGVELWGERLDGLRGEALVAAVQQAAAPRLDTPLSLVLESENGRVETHSEIVPRAAGFSLDASATAVKALQLGRGAFFTGLAARARTWIRAESIEGVLVVDEPSWRTTLDAIALKHERLPQEASLVVVEGVAKVVAGEAGVAVDEGLLRTRVEEALAQGRRKVALPLEQVEPAVTTSAALEALEAAQVFLSAPLVLTYRDQEYVVTVDDLARLVLVNIAGIAVGRPLMLSPEQTMSELETLLTGVERPPVEAEIIPAEDGRGFVVRESSDGTVIQWEALVASMERVAAQPARRLVAIPTTVAKPKLSTDDALLLATRRPVASFRTFFSPANEARAHNIRQVAGLLDGVVISPGTEFSFNTTVGPRTVAAGFDVAPVISGGVLRPGVGGGICQVSTTLFNAVFFAGLPVVERWPHSFLIDRYPLGRDATVSYGSQDFRFRNDSDQVILISVSTGETWVEVSLSAPSWEREVDYRVIETGDPVPPLSSPDKPRVLRDPTLPPGSRSEVEEGIPGRMTEVHRLVYGPEGHVLFEDTFNSEYAPKDYIVRVGA
jgi:vancomycin resistance protein YoaR